MRNLPIALAAALAACAPRAFATAQEVPARWGSYTLELVDESGRVLPTFEHRGRAYVLGTLGQRYLLRVRNGTGRRIEVVASVDGRDVVDGRPASFDKRGYVIAPHGELTIDGFRTSQASVAAFRFSSVPRSYAARTGDARDVGVVGVAVFPERWPRTAPPPYPPPYSSPYPDPEPYPSYGPPQGDARPEARRDGSETAQESGPPSTPRGEALAEPHSGRSHGHAPPHRPGLGTEFAEQHASRVEHVSFEREAPRPEAVLTLRYDDRPGLVALGVDVDRWARGKERWLRETATPFRSEPGYCEPPPGWRAR